MATVRDSAVLRALVDRYALTRAARTGKAVRDFLIDYEELLKAAGCAGGDARVYSPAIARLTPLTMVETGLPSFSNCSAQ